MKMALIMTLDLPKTTDDILNMKKTLSAVEVKTNKYGEVEEAVDHRRIACSNQVSEGRRRTTTAREHSTAPARPYEQVLLHGARGRRAAHRLQGAAAAALRRASALEAQQAGLRAAAGCLLDGDWLSGSM